MKKINTYSVKNWSDIPTVWKNTKEVKKVKYTNSPFDKELLNMLSPIAGDDNLRPIMSGVNFDDFGITVTNAHVLVNIPEPNEKYKGTYSTIPKRDYTVDKNSGVEIKNNMFISPKYPQYEQAIPKQKDAIRTHKVNVYKILQWTEVALKYCNQGSFNVVYWFGDDSISFNAKFMIDAMKLLLKLGYSEVYCSSSVSNRAVVFSPDEKYVLGKSVILLLMPVMKNNSYLSKNEVKNESEDNIKGGSFDIDFSRELLAYYDFSTDNIRNADDSIAEFKMFYGDYDVLPENEIKMLNKFAEKNTIPILDFFAVKNNHIHASDVGSYEKGSSLLIKHTELEDGLYDVLDGAIELNESGDVDDYPLGIEVLEPKIKFIIGSDVLDYYINIALKFVSKDTLRPQFTGVLFDYKDGKMYIVSTNAHILEKIDITKYIEVNKEQADFKFIVNTTNLTKFFNNIESSAITVSANEKNVSFENENYIFSSKLVDAKYSNYEGVISHFNENKLNLSKKELLDCINSDEAKKFIKDHKKENVIIFDELASDGRLDIYLGVSDSYRSETNPSILEKVKVGNVSYSKEEGTFQIIDSTLLIMPMAIENVSLFAFDVKYLATILDSLNCDDFNFQYKTTNRGYFVTGSCLDYGTVVKPTSSYKSTAKKTKKDAEIEELETLIELLKEVVAENPKDLDSKDALDLYEETLVELKKVNTEKLAKGGSINSMTEGKIKSVLDKEWSFDDRIESYRNRIKRGKYIDKEFNGEEYFLIEDVNSKKVYQPVGKIVYDFFDKNTNKNVESNDYFPVPEITSNDVDVFYKYAKMSGFKKADWEEFGNPINWTDEEMMEYFGDEGIYYFSGDNLRWLGEEGFSKWLGKLKKAVGEVYEERIEKFAKGGKVSDYHDVPYWTYKGSNASDRIFGDLESSKKELIKKRKEDYYKNVPETLIIVNVPADERLNIPKRYMVLHLDKDYKFDKQGMVLSYEKGGSVSSELDEMYNHIGSKKPKEIIVESEGKKIKYNYLVKNPTYYVLEERIYHEDNEDHEGWEYISSYGSPNAWDVKHAFRWEMNNVLGLPNYEKGGDVGCGCNHSYEKGGVLDSNGSKYFSKTFESKGNTWNVLFVWGKFNYVSVTKKTNNPFGMGVGKDFKNTDEAIAYYKNPDMKVQLIFAENEAKELGYVPKFENGGVISERMTQEDVQDYLRNNIVSKFGIDLDDISYEENENGNWIITIDFEDMGDNSLEIQKMFSGLSTNLIGTRGTETARQFILIPNDVRLNFENGGYVNVPSEKVIEDFYKSIESKGENTTVGIYKKEGILTDDSIGRIMQGYATGATPKEEFQLINRIYRKSIDMQKGDVVYFNEKEYGKKFRGEILDVLNENDFLVSRGIKTFIINKNDIIGLAPKKEDDLFNVGVSIYDERITDINSTVFYTTYGVGNNPFEVNYDESNEYGYGIYFLDEKYSGIGKYNESRILAIKPNVKKPLIFLNDDGSSFNSQYKEAYDNAVKYDGVTSKDDFNRKMVEIGYDSMLVSDIHGMHLIFFYNDPDLYKIKSDKGA